MDFEEFMRASQAALLRLATVLTGDAGRADEIVAIALGRAYERWGRIGEVEFPEAYVRRMIVNEFLTQKRRERRRTLLPLGEEHVSPAPDHAYVHALRDDLRGRVAALPAKQRAAIVLRYYGGLPDEEIASALGCAHGTVRSLISRALATLRIDGAVTAVEPDPPVARTPRTEGTLR